MAVFLVVMGVLAVAAGSGVVVRKSSGVRVHSVELVPYGTTVLRFRGLVVYVATGWPYAQVGVRDGNTVLLRPLVREGEGELWVRLQDGREYRLLMRVNPEAKLAKTYRF